MKKINFIKMVGAGNDFIVLDSKAKGKGLRVKNYCQLARKLCARKNGIGADGMLVLEKSKIADFRMRIFNADGSEAEMCGNGLRCVVLFLGNKGKVRVETKAGIYEGEITAKDKVKVKMQEPKDLKLNFPINVNGRKIKVNFINTGVPHTVVFVDGLDKIDVDAIGSAMRYHDEFKPKGTNVDFVEIIDDNNIKMRTYERGVEGETSACGTGAAASGIISRVKGEKHRVKVNVHTLGGILKVEFQKVDNKIKNVYLEGEAKKVFTGQTALRF
nr:diaminopimelate epimerase [Candidatus Omnitrophota bacterium]